MGKKIVNLYGLLCVLSFVVISVCGFSPWYKQKFVTFGIAGVLKLEVSLLTAHVPGDSVLFCGVIRRFKKQVPRTCSDLKDPKMLQDVASDWCSPVIAGAWPVPCQAFNSAYVMGIIVMLCYALNVLCLLTCFYLLYYYVESKSHKKVYRHWAMYMHAIGTGIFMMSCILYSVFAMGRLNAIGGSGIPGFFESSGGVGISPGFFLVWTGIICQLIALGLHGCMKLKDEETEEQKLYKEMLKEQQQYGAMEAQASSHEPQYTGADAYAQGSYSAPAPMSVMGPAYAQAPVAANMPGLPQAPQTGGAPAPGQAAW